MVVFLDVNAKMIKLYSDKGIKEIPFTQANTLNYHLAGASSVMYVTQVINAPVQDVIDLATSQAGASTAGLPPVDPKNDPLHVRHTGKGILNVSELGFTDDKGMINPETFHGPVDFKPLNVLEKKGFNESVQVQALLKAGKLEVIPLSVCKQIRLEWERNNNNDAELDQMMIPEGMKPEEYLRKVQAGEIISDDISSDAIEIDINASGFGAGQSTKNEGRLLPSDFSG